MAERARSGRQRGTGRISPSATGFPAGEERGPTTSFHGGWRCFPGRGGRTEKPAERQAECGEGEELESRDGRDVAEA